MEQREHVLKAAALLHGKRFRLWRKYVQANGFPKGFLAKEFRMFLPADQLGPMALRLYILLLLCANNRGEAWRTVPEMAEELGASIRQVQRGLAELEDKHLVAKLKYSQKHKNRFFLLPYGYVPAEQREEQV